MIPVDAEVMFEIAPRFSGTLVSAQASIVNAVAQILTLTLATYAVDTRLRIAHFLGQTCHESAEFRTTEEFASGEAYEGRANLGNTKFGDGVRYKRRGRFGKTVGGDAIDLSIAEFGAHTWDLR
jgi:putative chitinase